MASAPLQVHKTETEMMVESYGRNGCDKDLLPPVLDGIPASNAGLSRCIFYLRDGKCKKQRESVHPVMLKGGLE